MDYTALLCTMWYISLTEYPVDKVATTLMVVARQLSLGQGKSLKPLGGRKIVTDKQLYHP